MCVHRGIVCVAGLTLLLPAVAAGQVLGTFTWQLQPYCNVLTLTVTGMPTGYALQGFDDQCGAATRAPASGVAVPNPNGTIAMTLAVTPAGVAHRLDVSAVLSPPSYSGTWSDAVGSGGTLVFAGGAAGSPRPVEQVRKVMIPESAFTGRYGEQTVRKILAAGGVYILGGSTTAALEGLVAPVELPHGSRITEMRAVAVDSSPVAGEEITVRLFRQSFAGGSFTSVAAVTTSGAPGLISESTPVSEVVDTSDHSYTVLALGAISSIRRLLGVEISYVPTSW